MEYRQNNSFLKLTKVKVRFKIINQNYTILQLKIEQEGFQSDAMEYIYMIQQVGHVVVKVVDYIFQKIKEAKYLHVSRIFVKLGGLSGAAALSMVAYHEFGKYEFFA